MNVDQLLNQAMQSAPYFILKDKQIIPCEDVIEWGTWLETRQQIVARKYYKGYMVCTDFMGLDHGYGRTRRPILFETMIADTTKAIMEDGQFLDYQTRCCTYKQAMKMHTKAIAYLKETVNRVKKPKKSTMRVGRFGLAVQSAAHSKAERMIMRLRA